RRRGSAPPSPGTRAAASAREIRRMAEPALDARLERFLATRLRDAGAVRVTRLERSTEGFSQETFSFDVQIVRRDGTSEERGWVAKREPVAGLLEPYDLEPEFRVLHALSDDPFPSPPTPWFERDPAVLERAFYVMERLPGDVPLPTATADGAGRRSPARSRASTLSTGGASASRSSARRRPAARPRSASSRAGRHASRRAPCPSNRRSPRRSTGCAATCRGPTTSRSCTATTASATSSWCATPA